MKNWVRNEYWRGIQRKKITKPSVQIIHKLQQSTLNWSTCVDWKGSLIVRQKAMINDWKKSVKNSSWALNCALNVKICWNRWLVAKGSQEQTEEIADLPTIYFQRQKNGDVAVSENNAESFFYFSFCLKNGNPDYSFIIWATGKDKMP